MSILANPLGHLEVVTPDDDNDLQVKSRSVHVGVAGDLAVITEAGESVVIPDLGVGWHPIRVTRILATGTTADSITAGA